MEENNENVVKEEKQETKQAEVVQNNTQKRLNSSAIVSFICSLVGLLVAGLPLGIVSIITGILGLTSFKPEVENNKWMAIVGLIVGVVDVICVIVYLSVLPKLY